jgi:uncharacterized small protein (DUF1192 family)
MIIVRETDKGEFLRMDVRANPIVYSLDGTEKTRLNVVLADSWTDEERKRFGIHRVAPVVTPDNQVLAAPPRFEKTKDGRVIETATFNNKEPDPEPQPSRYDILLQTVEELNARVAVLEDEAKQRAGKPDARG